MLISPSRGLLPVADVASVLDRTMLGEEPVRLALSSYPLVPTLAVSEVSFSSLFFLRLTILCFLFFGLALGPELPKVYTVAVDDIVARLGLVASVPPPEATDVAEDTALREAIDDWSLAKPGRVGVFVPLISSRYALAHARYTVSLMAGVNRLSVR